MSEQEKKPGPITQGKKFCSWESENGLVVKWASEITIIYCSLCSSIQDNIESKTISNLKTAK